MSVILTPRSPGSDAGHVIDNDTDSETLHPAIRGLRTVCRCNNIKYRTIEKAIREGATTIDAVAVRTTATTGHCGGSCTPNVQEMIEEITEGE